jgi:alginate O-acetyltransferase complex protein AlgI
MVFTSAVFLYLFLPLFLVVYYLLPGGRTGLPPRARLAWILLASWVFYGWWRLDFLALIVASTVWTWLGGLWIGRLRHGSPVLSGRSPGARAAVGLGVALNLGVLGYFKYFNFGVRSLNALLACLGARTLTAWEVVLPVGISFYLFHSISYLVDVYRGDAPVATDFLELAVYMALFPQLVAGPIIRYKDLCPQLRERSHSFAGFSEGAARFMAGFCKKVLIADLVAPIANSGFALGAPTLAEAWLAALAYTAQLYFDFSGYSDMAVGLGLMMGFRFPENFRTPYLSRSITEFWRRWHISLSTWLRDYLYIPLGGNRRGNARTLLNLMVVMVLGGLWHGAAWTFILWGAWHGLFLALERGRRRSAEAGGQAMAARAAAGRTTAPLGPRTLAVAATMLIVIAGWVLFRSPTLGAALLQYAGMIGLHGLGLGAQLRWQLGGLELAVLALALAAVYVGPWLGRRLSPEAASAAAPIAAAPSAAPAAAAGATAARAGAWVLQWPLAARLAVVALFVLALLRTAAESFSPFLYFQF